VPEVVLLVLPALELEVATGQRMPSSWIRSHFARQSRPLYLRLGTARPVLTSGHSVYHREQSICSKSARLKLHKSG
jgi:hypothetical protein